MNPDQKNRSFVKSRTSLFLMEFIIAILFFSTASAVCMQLFTRAHVIDVKTRELNHAVSVSQSVAETLRGTDGALSSVAACFPQASVQGSRLLLSFDERWRNCPQADAAYQCMADFNHNEGLIDVHISVIRVSDQSEIYSLHTMKCTDNEKRSL